MDRINEVTRRCFDAIIEVRRMEAASAPPADQLAARLRSFVEAMRQAATDAGYREQDVHDIAYAVVALCDEVMLAKEAPLGPSWTAHLLQMHYFHENTAGDGFFTRIKEIRSDPQRAEVLRVYYLCLLLGFKGRYRVRGGELELMNIAESLQHDLIRSGQIKGEQLSPCAEPPPAPMAQRATGKALLLGVGGALVLALALYFGLSLALGSEADSVAELIQQLVKT